MGIAFGLPDPIVSSVIPCILCTPQPHSCHRTYICRSVSHLMFSPGDSALEPSNLSLKLAGSLFPNRRHTSPWRKKQHLQHLDSPASQQPLGTLVRSKVHGYMVTALDPHALTCPCLPSSCRTRLKHDCVGGSLNHIRGRLVMLPTHCAPLFILELEYYCYPHQQTRSFTIVHTRALLQRNTTCKHV